ncbi:MAG: ABC transporter permease [Nitrospirota bacterium]
MLWLAIKTLFHEKGRLVITLFGITFASFLSLLQVAMYLGMMGNATDIIKHIDADIWITSKNIQCFDFANPIPNEKINRIDRFSDILWTEKLIISFGYLKLQNGGIEQVQIVGFNPDTGIGAPWSMLSGSPSDVKGGRYMIIDNSSEQRLGKLNVGTIYELSGMKFRLVGISQGLRSFTTMPVLFISYNQAQTVESFIPKNNTSFIVAKVSAKEKITSIVEELKRCMNNNDVYTKSDFIYKTMMYWTVETGIGMSFFLTAILGLLVGASIVGQTVYSNTMEHLREFGTLKALGAKNTDVYEVIFIQIGISCIIGYIISSVSILLLRSKMEAVGVSLSLTPGLFFVLFFILLFICLLSSYFSVREIRRLDPAIVFRS